MVIANIHGISTPALAAGAIWVQSETALAAIQQGWMQITMMRTLKLLGKKDPGAAKSYTILCVLSILVITLTNIPLVLWGAELGKVVSNDPDVQGWFSRIVWVLVLHSQIRMGNVCAAILFIPMGKFVLAITVNVVSYYIIATPVTIVISLTDLVTESVIIKLTCCLATTSMAMCLGVIFSFTYLSVMNWEDAANVINNRANTDKDLLTS